MPLSNSARADLVLVLVTLLAAAGWIFSKEALQGLPPLLFIGIRFVLAGLVLLLVGRAKWHWLRRADLLPRALLLGAVMAMAILTWIQGLDKGQHLGEGAFITSLGVVLVPVTAWLIYGERASGNTLVALPVAVAGLALLSLNGGFNTDPGQLYFLAAALLFSLHFTLMAHLACAMPAVILAAIQLLMVGSINGLVSVFIEPWPEAVEAGIWGWLLASALIATSLRFTLQTYGQGLAPASHAALIMILEPVWTALLAAFWFAEQMTAQQLLGCGLIFGAMLISRWRWVRGLVIKRAS
ncbi:DMT family transporter [Motiliproteus sp.]|uniref:DMT family transporter n=1 Tax=Motiliproteus sp. TaxID=1898955 RepID=UPI003BAD45C5